MKANHAMPSITVHFDPANGAVDDGFAEFAAQAAEAAETVLGAAPDKIQVLSLAMAHPPLGLPIYIEIKTRDTENRPDAVVETFVARVDALSRKYFETPCRIRYFRYPGSFLAAAN